MSVTIHVEHLVGIEEWNSATLSRIIRILEGLNFKNDKIVRYEDLDDEGEYRNSRYVTLDSIQYARPFPSFVICSFEDSLYLEVECYFRLFQDSGLLLQTDPFFQTDNNWIIRYTASHTFLMQHPEFPFMEIVKNLHVASNSIKTLVYTDPLYMSEDEATYHNVLAENNMDHLYIPLMSSVIIGRNSFINKGELIDKVTKIRNLWPETIQKKQWDRQKFPIAEEILPNGHLFLQYN